MAQVAGSEFDRGEPPAGAERTLRILSGGAANGLVSRVETRFGGDTGYSITGDFGAVGLMRDRVVEREPVDVIILTRALIDELTRSGHVDPDTVRDLGQVATGIAVRTGDAHPAVSNSADLRQVLEDAALLYVPHTTRSTAGRHVASVIASLGLQSLYGPRLREFANGQTAMTAMASEGERGAVGCTQITEILNTEGVDYVGDLPAEHALQTVYTAAVSTHAANPDAARSLVDLLAAPDEQDARNAAGFA